MAEKQKKQVLTESFLVELFKSCISNLNVLEVIYQHLEFNYLPEESYKKVWKMIKENYELTNHCATIGILNEKLKDDQKALKLLVEIKKCKIPEIDNIFPTFETFIKEVRFIELYTETGKLWNAGDQEKAIKILATESEKINSFALKEGLYGKVFAGFAKRQEERKNKDHQAELKVPFGIHCMDFDTRGGGRVGTSGLLLGRSGTGKTTFLRWVGICAARIGLRVIHFQIEGTEDECMEAYDAAWTGTTLEDIEYGGISKQNMKIVKDVADDMIFKRAEIFVIAPEEFGSLFIEDCDDSIEEIEKIYGKISLVLFDNLELFETKGKFFNSEMGERKRREALANKITTISIKRKLFALATTQANDIRPDRYNNPDFVMTRSDISEFKGMIKPFSYFWTWNMTQDEKENNMGRLYADKYRKHKDGQIRTICTHLETGRFYDSAKTVDQCWNPAKNEPK